MRNKRTRRRFSRRAIRAELGSFADGTVNFGTNLGLLDSIAARSKMYTLEVAAKLAKGC